MASKNRVENVTNGRWMKQRRAERAVETCSAEWIEYGVSIRNLTLAEAIAARNQQAAVREPLPYKEIHGLRFEPSVSGMEATKREGLLAWEAHKYAQAVIQ